MRRGRRAGGCGCVLRGGGGSREGGGESALVPDFFNAELFPEKRREGGGYA